MSIKAVEWALQVRGVTPDEKALLCALGDRHNKDTDLCCPDQVMLAADACMSERSARKFLALLELRGFISRKKLSKGKGLITHYTLHFNRRTPLAVDSNRQPTPVAKNSNEMVDPNGSIVPVGLSDSAADQPAQPGRPTGNCVPVHKNNRKEPESSVPNGTAQRQLFEEDRPPESKPSSNASTKRPQTSDATARIALQKASIFAVGVTMLVSQGSGEAAARGFLGKLIKVSSVTICFEAVQASISTQPGDARSWLRAAVEDRARRAGMRKVQSSAGSDWSAAAAAWVRSGVWPVKRGDRPDEPKYAGTLEALEAILPSMPAEHPNTAGVRANIQRLSRRTA